ncbi:DUF3298 domain-containing protein [Rhabdochromatium marinum]|uniref:DUF3298 domain-containing protein n=1 Tax=Rhabdochromatium marinum TaxID=48729 RepID=UPI0019052DB4|nr:DUF3298 domain-containing protein [Rhabdochromatium marinum]MBK1647412.1 hypothetical protein [Rhabdochromatium marinum]
MPATCTVMTPQHRQPHSTWLGAVLCGALSLLPTVTTAASFDCSQAAHPVEQLICNEAELSSLDQRLATLYQQAREKVGADIKPLQAQQRDWLTERNACDTSECVAEAYRQRIAALEIRVEGPLGPITERKEAGWVEIIQQGPQIELKARYPHLSGEDTATLAANRRIAARVRQQLDDFRTSYLEFLFDNQGEHLGPPWAMEIDFASLYSGPRFWTIDLTTYSYTGGAHGAFDHQALVLGRDHGERLAPAELFRPDSDWLQRLAELSLAKLSAREPFSADSDDDWLREGTAPKAENYQVLLPLADGLKVIFGQYQIGPYAIGIFDVMLGYDELVGLLNPAWFGP